MKGRDCRLEAIWRIEAEHARAGLFERIYPVRPGARAANRSAGRTARARDAPTGRAARNCRHRDTATDEHRGELWEAADTAPMSSYRKPGRTVCTTSSGCTTQRTSATRECGPSPRTPCSWGLGIKLGLPLPCFVEHLSIGRTTPSNPRTRPQGQRAGGAVAAAAAGRGLGRPPPCTGRGEGGGGVAGAAGRAGA